MRVSFFLLMFVFSLVLSAQSTKSYRTMSPKMRSSYANDSTFSNPADLLLNNQYLGAEFNMSAINNRSGFQLFGHLTDFLVFGDLAIGFNYFGPDLSKNVVLIEKVVPCRENPALLCNDLSLSLIKSGTKYSFTWAKKFGVLSLGAQYRLYHYKDLQDQLAERLSQSLDFGLFFIPLDEIYLGLAFRNISGSRLRDGNGDDVYENGRQVIIPEDTMLSLGVSPKHRQFGFSLGIPIDAHTGLTGDFLQFAQQASAHVWMRILDPLNLSLGYNVRDYYVAFDYEMSPMLSVSLMGSKMAALGGDSFISFALNLGLYNTEGSSKPSKSTKFESRIRSREQRRGKFD